MEIAVATHTAPGQWRGESDWTLSTVLDVLDRQAADIRAAAKGR